jgi:hypothetical protein
MAHIPKNGGKTDKLVEENFRKLVKEKEWKLLSEPFEVAVPAMKTPVLPAMEKPVAKGGFNQAEKYYPHNGVVNFKDGGEPVYYTASHVFIALPDIQNAGSTAHKEILESGLRVNLVSQSMGDDSGHVYESKNLVDVQAPAPKLRSFHATQYAVKHSWNQLHGKTKLMTAVTSSTAQLSVESATAIKPNMMAQIGATNHKVTAVDSSNNQITVHPPVASAQVDDPITIQDSNSTDGSLPEHHGREWAPNAKEEQKKAPNAKEEQKKEQKKEEQKKAPNAK